jgi:hypothetical protein
MGRESEEIQGVCVMITIVDDGDFNLGGMYSEKMF